MNIINEDLLDHYVETFYQFWIPTFQKGVLTAHGKSHVKSVANLITYINQLQRPSIFNDESLLRITALFHDVGMIFGRKNHAEYSYNALLNIIYKLLINNSVISEERRYEKFLVAGCCGCHSSPMYVKFMNIWKFLRKYYCINGRVFTQKEFVFIPIDFSDHNKLINTIGNNFKKIVDITGFYTKYTLSSEGIIPAKKLIKIERWESNFSWQPYSKKNYDEYYLVLPFSNFSIDLFKIIIENTQNIQQNTYVVEQIINSINNYNFTLFDEHSGIKIKRRCILCDPTNYNQGNCFRDFKIVSPLLNFADLLDNDKFRAPEFVYNLFNNLYHTEQWKNSRKYWLGCLLINHILINYDGGSDDTLFIQLKPKEYIRQKITQNNENFILDSLATIIYDEMLQYYGENFLIYDIKQNKVKIIPAEGEGDGFYYNWDESRDDFISNLRYLII